MNAISVSSAAVRSVCASFAMLCLLTACDSDNNDLFVDACSSSRIFGSSQAGLVNGCANVARFSNPANVEVDPTGRVFVADFDNDAVRVISTSGIVSTLVSSTSVTPPATFSRPFGLTFAPNGRLYVQTDGNDTGQRDGTTGTIWEVNLTTRLATVVARNLGRPRGIQALQNGNIALSDLTHHTISILNPATAVVTPLAGANDTPGFADGTGNIARFNRPYGIALLTDGSLLVADQNNHRLRRITMLGEVTTVAGGATPGNTNGPVATARFNFPQDVAVVGTAAYVADHDNFLIRRILNGVVTTEAGSGTQGFADGEGASAQFFGLEGIAVTLDGNTLWIADGNNGTGQPFNRVRRLPTQ